MITTRLRALTLLVVLIVSCAYAVTTATAATRAATPSGVSPRAAQCSPYCDATTVRVAKRLNGRGHGGWLATTLDSGGYRGRRWAEIDRIPAGHGKRYVGVIHVPAGNAAKVRAALSDVWVAQRGTVFVLPLVTRYDTRGGAAPIYRSTARWAAKRLGSGWVVR